MLMKIVYGLKPFKMVTTNAMDLTQTTTVILPMETLTPTTLLPLKPVTSITGLLLMKMLCGQKKIDFAQKPTLIQFGLNSNVPKLLVCFKD